MSMGDSPVGRAAGGSAFTLFSLTHSLEYHPKINSVYMIHQFHPSSSNLNLLPKSIGHLVFPPFAIHYFSSPEQLTLSKVSPSGMLIPYHSFIHSSNISFKKYLKLFLEEIFRDWCLTDSQNERKTNGP